MAVTRASNMFIKLESSAYYVPVEATLDVPLGSFFLKGAQTLTNAAVGGLTLWLVRARSSDGAALTMPTAAEETHAVFVTPSQMLKSFLDLAWQPPSFFLIRVTRTRFIKIFFARTRTVFMFLES